ncbi:hypothetical protein SO802_004461 [Lithocarpus litseifolius]|uniref:Uncharacterized protein n=1 Tax=Lithocarpus litseifolius TaxID=425828 RepID=A0AAW2E304_9ROSI
MVHHNRDLFSIDSLNVSVGYRGREQGSRASSYVNATLDLNRLEVSHDVFYLLEDLAKGLIPFDTNTQVNGVLGFFFLFFKFEESFKAVSMTKVLEHEEKFSEREIFLFHIGPVRKSRLSDD